MQNHTTTTPTSASRALGVLVALLCLVLTVMAAPSASAAARKPAPTALHAGHVTASAATLTWHRPRGARVFRVKYSASRTMAHPHYRTLRGARAHLAGLRSHHRYYVRVRALHPRSHRVMTRYSRKMSFVTAARSYSLPTPPTAPVPAPGRGTMKYGVSATDGNFVSGYKAQMTKLGANVGYLYGQDPRGKQFAGVPENQDLWLQTKATTRAQFDAMLASFPKHRAGKVYLHYHNEPEDNIASGSLTLRQWQERTDALYAAIDAAHLPYVVKSAELMYYTLQQSNNGTGDPARQIKNYLRPGVQQVGFSAYAEKKLKGGHEVAGTDPVKMPATLKAWSARTGLPFSVITGWAVDTRLLHDPVTLENRRAWLAAVAPRLQAAGAQHLMWFDIPWSNGDYRLETDPGLLAVWHKLCR